jgi:hypothetical protein
MGLITIPWSSVGDNIAMVEAMKAAEAAGAITQAHDEAGPDEGGSDNPAPSTRPAETGG